METQRITNIMETTSIFCLETREDADDYWRITDGIWLTREEALAHIQAHPHDFEGIEYQVFSRFTNGKLRDLLEEITEVEE